MQKFAVWKKRSFKKALHGFLGYCIWMYGRNWFGCYMLVTSAWEGSSLDQRKMQKEVLVGFPCFVPPVAEMDCLNPEVLAMRRKLLASYHQIGGLKSLWTLGAADRTSPSTGFWLEVCLRKGAVVSQESGRRKAVSRLRYTLEVSDMVTRHMPFWKAAFKLAEELLHKSDRPFVYHEVVSQLIWQTGERSFRKKSLQEKSC